jgi:hypothetical protein
VPLTQFRFADRDMMMRYRGGAVGHYSTWKATAALLDDATYMDEPYTADSDFDDLDIEPDTQEPSQIPDELENEPVDPHSAGGVNSEDEDQESLGEEIDEILGSEEDEDEMGDENLLGEVEANGYGDF